MSGGRGQTVPVTLTARAACLRQLEHERDGGGQDADAYDAHQVRMPAHLVHELCLRMPRALFIIIVSLQHR